MRLFDHCRIGSLEIQRVMTLGTEPDHCRIGSLEMITLLDFLDGGDHCRIGSLENNLRSLEP